MEDAKESAVETEATATTTAASLLGEAKKAAVEKLEDSNERIAQARHENERFRVIVEQNRVWAETSAKSMLRALEVANSILKHSPGISWEDAWERALSSKSKVDRPLSSRTGTLRRQGTVIPLHSRCSACETCIVGSNQN